MAIRTFIHKTKFSFTPDIRGVLTKCNSSDMLEEANKTGGKGMIIFCKKHGACKIGNLERPICPQCLKEEREAKERR